MSDKERWEREKEERQFLLKLALAREEEAGFLTDKEIDRIVCDRLREKENEEELKEYLVDGAVLTCTSAKWGNFYLSDGSSIHLEGAEEKEKKGDPIGILKVQENPMYTDNLHHANVADTKRGFNIMPFPCNCMEPALPEQETDIGRNRADCQKNGVCKYLMDLEEEWENIDFSEPEYIAMGDAPSYKEFDDVDATTALGVAYVGSLRNGGLKNGQKQGITRTSVLFCKHGGFIYPVTSGQIGESDEFQFTLEQLKGCGWETATEEDLRILNGAMLKYGITSRDSAYMMLATMLAESGCTDKIEGGEALLSKMKEKGEDKAWEEYQSNVRGNGNAMSDYNWWNRGAGYMQITDQELHEQFLKYIDDPFDGKDTATYIGNNYPIESAVWYWTKVKKTGKGNLDAYVTENGAWEGMFLVTQYFVNGFQNAKNDVLVKIKEGEDYTINEEQTTVSVDEV